MPRVVSATGLSVGLSLLLCGCGSGVSDKPELIPVSGTITRGGQPVSGVLVEFHPVSGQPASGRTDEQGRYTLLYRGSEPGVAAGEHEVHIIVDGNPQSGPDAGGAGGGAGPPPPPLPEPVAHVVPKRVVVDGASTTFDFNMDEIEN